MASLAKEDVWQELQDSVQGTFAMSPQGSTDMSSTSAQVTCPACSTQYEMRNSSQSICGGCEDVMRPFSCDNPIIENADDQLSFEEPNSVVSFSENNSLSQYSTDQPATNENSESTIEKLSSENGDEIPVSSVSEEKQPVSPFSTLLCACRDAHCPSKQNQKVIGDCDSLWRCCNRKCTNRFDTQCAYRQGCLKGPQSCFKCSFEHCRCRNPSCVSKRDSIPVDLTYLCDNNKLGCKSRFFAESCLTESDGVCVDCPFEGHAAHNELFRKCMTYDTPLDDSYTGMRVRVQMVLPSKSSESGPGRGGSKGWGYQWANNEGYDLLFEESPKISLSAVEWQYLFLITKHGTIFRLCALDPNAEPVRTASKPRHEEIPIWGKGTEHLDMSGPWLPGILHKMRDGDHYVEYNDKNIEAEYMPSKEEDPDECFESLFSIGWYSYTGGSDNKPQPQVGSEGEPASENRVPAGDDEEPVVDAEDHNDSPDDDEGAVSVDSAVLVAPSEVSWADGCYHQMGSCGKLETGLRIRLRGCANNRTSKLTDPTNKEPEPAWACQNKNGSVTIKYDKCTKTKNRPEKIDSLETLKQFVDADYYQLVPVSPMAVHKSHQLAMQLKEVLKCGYYARIVTVTVGSREQTYHFFNDPRQTKSTQNVLFDTPGFPLAYKGFRTKYNTSRLEIYHFLVHTAKLYSHGKDFRGYVFPAMLRYNGDGTENNTAFVGKDIIGICIFETRCDERRNDLIVHDLEKDEVTRIAYDDYKSCVGCGPFLRTRYCDLEYDISESLMLKIMTAFSNYIDVMMYEYQPLRNIHNTCKDPVAAISRENALRRELEESGKKKKPPSFVGDPPSPRSPQPPPSGDEGAISSGTHNRPRTRGRNKNNQSAAATNINKRGRPPSSAATSSISAGTSDEDDLLHLSQSKGKGKGKRGGGRAPKAQRKSAVDLTADGDFNSSFDSTDFINMSASPATQRRLPPLQVYNMTTGTPNNPHPPNTLPAASNARQREESLQQELTASRRALAEMQGQLANLPSLLRSAVGIAVSEYHTAANYNPPSQPQNQPAVTQTRGRRGRQPAQQQEVAPVQPPHNLQDVEGDGSHSIEMPEVVVPPRHPHVPEVAPPRHPHVPEVAPPRHPHVSEVAPPRHPYGVVAAEYPPGHPHGAVPEVYPPRHPHGQYGVEAFPPNYRYVEVGGYPQHLSQGQYGAYNHPQYSHPQHGPLGAYTHPQHGPLGAYTHPQHGPLGAFTHPQHGPLGAYTHPQHGPLGAYTHPQHGPLGAFTHPQQQSSPMTVPLQGFLAMTQAHNHALSNLISSNTQINTSNNNLCATQAVIDGNISGLNQMQQQTYRQYF